MMIRNLTDKLKKKSKKINICNGVIPEIEIQTYLSLIMKIWMMKQLRLHFQKQVHVKCNHTVLTQMQMTFVPMVS